MARCVVAIPVVVVASVLVACGGGDADEVATFGAPEQEQLEPGWVEIDTPPQLLPMVGDGERVAMYSETGGESFLLDGPEGWWREMDDLPFDAEGIWQGRYRFLPDGRLVTGASLCDEGFEQESASVYCDGSWRFELAISEAPGSTSWGEPLPLATVHDDDPSSDRMQVTVEPGNGEAIVVLQTPNIRIDAPGGTPYEFVSVDPDTGEVLDRSPAPRHAQLCASGDGAVRYGGVVDGAAERGAGAVVEVEAYDGAEDVESIAVPTPHAVADGLCSDGGLLLASDVEGRSQPTHVALVGPTDDAGVEVVTHDAADWQISRGFLIDREAEVTVLPSDPAARLPYIPGVDWAAPAGPGVIACWGGESSAHCFFGVPSPDGSGAPVPEDKQQRQVGFGPDGIPD